MCPEVCIGNVLILLEVNSLKFIPWLMLLRHAILKMFLLVLKIFCNKLLHEGFRVVRASFFPFFWRLIILLYCRYADLVNSIKKKFAKKRGHSLLEEEDVCLEEKSKRAFQKPKD